MTVKGLIIRENNVGDYDRAVTILTKDHGIIRAFANGARRIKSRKMSSTGLLCYSDFSITSVRDTYRIDEASPIDIFFGLRSDFEALMLAEYFCELCQNFVEEEHSTSDYLRLILNSLAFLENKKRPARLIKAVTELRLLTLAGYMPDLSGCSCDTGAHLKFDTLGGVLVCADCRPENNRGVMTVNDTVVAAMRHITGCPFGRLYNFTLPCSDLDLLCSVCEGYVLMRADHGFPTLQFYNSIRLPENKV